MQYKVLIIAEAEEDIFEIYNYVATFDAIGKAEKLFANLKETIESLDHQPNRGHVPPELERINVDDFLEIHFKPYRIIYQVEDDNVFVHCVLDGRRDLHEILQKRLLRV